MARLSDVYGITKPVEKAPKPKPAIEAVAAEVRALEEDGPVIRLIFPAPKKMAKAIDEEWHRRKLKSRSETIRVLLREALGG